MRNRASNPLIPRSDALPLSHKDSTVEAAHYEVHITRVLHTAGISNVDSVMFVDGIREMVSFELGKEIKKDVYRLVTSMGQIKIYSCLLTPSCARNHVITCGLITVS